MIKYYDFVYLEKDKLIECLELKVNDKTEEVCLSPEAYDLLGADNYKGVPVTIDKTLTDVYLCVRYGDNEKDIKVL